MCGFVYPSPRILQVQVREGGIVTERKAKNRGDKGEVAKNYSKLSEFSKVQSLSHLERESF